MVDVQPKDLCTCGKVNIPFFGALLGHLDHRLQLGQDLIEPLCQPTLLKIAWD